MGQFGTIFRFELMSYLKNKIFLSITLVIVVLIACVLSFPRLQEMISGGDDNAVVEEDGTLSDDVSIFMIIDETAASEENRAFTQMLFQTIMVDMNIVMMDGDLESLQEEVKNENCNSALVIHSATEYTYITNDVTMYDNTEYMVQEVLFQKYQIETMESLGLSAEEASAVLNTTITGDVITLGTNQMDNFFYTYILIFGLYMVILLYGQFVATSVATEKSSRAMELLITSAKSNNLMFGKVLGAGVAGLVQLISILGVSYVSYQVNAEYWGANMIVQSIFDMPLSILIYTIVFFVLGFAIYSFLYGAVGSMATKVEDINTTSMPITFLFIIAFMIVVTGMTSGNVDSTIMIVASYFPFTSPMAMFTRIAMGNVPFTGVMISIVILILSTIGIGIFSAKIYRMGVLMYGNPPKLKAMVKLMLKRS